MSVERLFVVPVCHKRGPGRLPFLGVMRLHPPCQPKVWPAARFEEAIRYGGTKEHRSPDARGASVA